MDSIARVITVLFDAASLPFGSRRALALVILSVLSGAIFALLFRATSRPAAIKRARDRFQARVLEMRLYPDDPVLLTRAFLGALGTQGLYLRATAKPILILLVVALPVYFQLESRFARRPLHANERSTVTMTLKPGLDVRAVPLSLASSDELTVEPRSVRAPAVREIVWRIEPKIRGRHEVLARAYDVEYRFPVSAEDRARAVGVERRAGAWDGLVHAGLPPIPAQSAIQSVRISYPEASYRVLGARFGWLSLFLLGTLVGALIPMVLLRIQM
ncbi:MAG TPA: hypothetical protein VFU38_06065 [Candidatus Krumholzibacteria bacterium]|nr:hypothetical protein [Candidatus Krumholzibacteria bacterium]